MSIATRPETVKAEHRLKAAAKRRLREVTIRRRREMGLDQNPKPTHIGDLVKIVLQEARILEEGSK